VTLVPEIPTCLSLLVILATLAVTTVASLARSRREDRERVAPEPAAADPTALGAGEEAPGLPSRERRPTGTVSATAPDERGH
jgi:tellurite resistance protein TerC